MRQRLQGDEDVAPVGEGVEEGEAGQRPQALGQGVAADQAARLQADDQPQGEERKAVDKLHNLHVLCEERPQARRQHPPDPTPPIVLAALRRSLRAATQGAGAAAGK